MPNISRLILGVAACALPLRAQTRADIQRAERAITADDLLGDMRALSSDAFEGRAPGTRGEDSTVAWIAGAFRRVGLAPGMPDGYVQTVPLVGITSALSASATVRGATMPLAQHTDIAAWSMRETPTVNVTGSDIVFIGYGVQAPEYRWDDIKGVDLTGKTLLVLVGDPPVPNARDTTQLDLATFRGAAMTYYGRWTYKFEQAARLGAAAVLIVHQTGPAGYGWSVVESNLHERLDIAGAPAHAPVEGWIQLEAAKRLMAAAGQDFDALERQARTRAFRPVPLGATASFTVTNAVRRMQSRNVIGVLRGSDPALRDDYVVHSAHWDAYGIGRVIAPSQGSGYPLDSIYNGALDDASGIAWMLATARAYRALPTPPKRTLVFLAVTGEEANLLGSKWYAQHPVFPLARTVADINMDIANPWGRTRSIVSIGYGQTSLEDLLVREAARDGRTVKPDPESEKGYFYRADHFALVQQGVPALAFLFPGADYIGQPADYGTRKRAEYVANDYHKPSDEVKSDWDLAGMVDDTRLLFRVGLTVANGAAWPTWKPGTEFKATREASLKVRKN